MCSVSKLLKTIYNSLKSVQNIVKLPSPFFFGSGAHTKYIGKFIAFHAFCHICLHFVGSFGQRQLLPFGSHKQHRHEYDERWQAWGERVCKGSCLLKTDNERMEMTKNTAETVGS